MRIRRVESGGWLRGLVNPIDLGVIVLLGVAVWRLFAVYLPPTRQVRPVEVTVGFLSRNVPTYVSRSIAVGQDLFCDRTESYLGKISVKQTLPAVRTAEHSTPGLTAEYDDLHLQLRRSGRVITGAARGGVFLGGLAIRIGKRLKTHTFYTALNGEIIAIKIRRARPPNNGET
jgi:hypothetical protein